MSDVQTLGFLVLGWLSRHLTSPRDDTQSYRPADWQARRTLRWYELDEFGKRLWNRCHDEDPKGKGKALALDCPVPTPSGWTTMGQLRPGDLVLDESGAPTEVRAVSRVMIGRPCHEVVFDDGETIVADAAHLWLTTARRSPHARRGAALRGTARGAQGTWRHAVRTTREIADTLRYSNGTYRSANHSVSLAGALDLPDADLPVEPYTLGVWLGDGDSDQPRITMGDQDAPDLIAQLSAVGTTVGPRQRAHAAGRYTITTSGAGLRTPMRRAGLLGAKHVPAAYLRASLTQRQALLQGLMDTDGYIDAASGQCELSLSSEPLARGAHELVLTLGIKATIAEDRMTLGGRDVGPRWRVRFHPPADHPVFRLPRKAARQRVRHERRALSGERRIVSCDPVPSRPVRCITVAAPSGMFLVGRSMVPTHNSPHAAATVICEFRGPVVFDGWAREGDLYVCAWYGCSCGWVYRYRPGEPRGKPWGSPGLPSPWVQVAAVSEAQTANTWAALHGFLAANEKRTARWLGLEPGRTLVYWTDRVDAKIERVTSSAASRTGQPITHAVIDEPQEQTPELRGPELAYTILENLTKLDGWAHFTGNAPVMGRASVAEAFRAPAPRALHLGVRPSVTPREDMTRAELLPLLREVYEDTPWVPYERILDDAEDRVAHPWPSTWRLFLNLPWEPGGESVWMPADVWASRQGDPVSSAREPAYACVRIAHRHQWAAVAVAQVVGPAGRPVQLNKERRPMLREGDRVLLWCRVFTAAEGEQVDVSTIEAHLRQLRRTLPARVLAKVPVGTRGRERDGSLRGPEIAYAGAFWAGSAQRFRAERAALVDVPSTPERLAPAAETLMQVVQSGVLAHDGDADLAEQIADVVATPAVKGWKPEPRDDEAPIVAAIAAMLAVHRAVTAPRWHPAPVRGY